MASRVEIQSEGSKRHECGPTSSSQGPSVSAPRPPNCILVGVRPNLRGQETLDYVFSKIARKSDRIVILHILQAVPSLPPLSMENAETSKVLENAWWDVHRQKISDEVSHLLRPYKRICREKKIEAQIRIIHNSNVEKTLVQEAATMGASKLVIGSSDRAKIGGCNLPRCTMFKKETGPYHYIMKHAPEGCNVLVVGDGQLLHRSRKSSSSKGSCFKGEKGKLFPIPIPGPNSEPPKSFVTSTSEKMAKKSSPIKGVSSIHNFGRHTAKIIFSLSDGHSRRFSPSRFQFKEEEESPYHNMAKGKGKGSSKSINRMAASDILYPIENSMMDESAKKDGRCLSEGQRNQRYQRYDQHDEDLADDAESHSTELNSQLLRNSPINHVGLRDDVILEEQGEGVDEADDLVVPNHAEELVKPVHVNDEETNETSFRQRWIEGEEIEERGGSIDQTTGFEFDRTDIQFDTCSNQFYSSPEISFGRPYEENPDSSPIFHSDAISLKSQCDMEDDESMMTHSIRSYQLYASTVGQSSTNLTYGQLECDNYIELENRSELSGMIPHPSDDVGCSSQITELTALEEELLDRITEASELPYRLTSDIRCWDDSGVGMKHNTWFVTAMVRAKLVPNERTFLHLDQPQSSSPNQSRISRVFSRGLKRSTTTNLPLLHLGNVNLESDLRRVDQACADNMNLLTMEGPETSTISHSLNSPRSIVNGTDFFSGSTKSASSMMIMRAASKSSSSTAFSPLQLNTILEMMRDSEAEAEAEAKRSTPSPSPSPTPTPSHSPSPSYIPFDMNLSSPHRRLESVEDAPHLTRRHSLPLDNPLIRTSSLQKGAATARYFHFEELAYATNGFIKENMIGKGGYAYVFKGILPGGRRIAVKRLLKKGKEVDFLTEVGVVSHVRHPHATALLGYCIESSHRLLVYDLMVHGSLERNLHGKRKFMNWGKRMKAAIGSAKGLDYLHRICPHRIIHRDVKSANILIGSNWNAQISDFGLAKWVPDTKTFSSNGPIEGTFGYMAPEYFMQGELNEKTDVYAFGVVLLEIITGRRPIDIRRPISEQNLVAWAVPKLENWRVDEFIDPKLEDDFDVVQLRRVCAAALLCLRVCPDYRPPMDEITQLLECRAFSENQWQEIWEDLVEKKGGTGQIQRYSSIGAEYTDSMYKRDLQNHMALALALSIGQTETS